MWKNACSTVSVLENNLIVPTDSAHRIAPQAWTDGANSIDTSKLQTVNKVLLAYSDLTIVEFPHHMDHSQVTCILLNNIQQLRVQLDKVELWWVLYYVSSVTQLLRRVGGGAGAGGGGDGGVKAGEWRQRGGRGWRRWRRLVGSFSSHVWQSCRVRYLFFTSYGLARSATCGSVSTLQVEDQPTQISLHRNNRVTN